MNAQRELARRWRAKGRGKSITASADQQASGEELGRHQDCDRDDGHRDIRQRQGGGKGGVQPGRPEASLETVARRAGVGIGTLYRHFPTRDALYEAVYRHEVEQLVELAKLRRWLRAGVEFMATKKGMAAALALAAHGSSELVAYTLDRLSGAVGELLQRAMAAGELRADIDPEDLLQTVVGMCCAHDRPGWQARVLRLVDVFIDGLRRPLDKTHRS